MPQKPRLQAALDRAAEQLLARHFGTDDKPLAADPLPAIQIDAFKAVTTYFGPRTKLGKDDDANGAEYSQLRDRLHRTPSRRRSRAKTETNGHAIGFGAAEGAVDSDAGAAAGTEDQ